MRDHFDGSLNASSTFAADFFLLDFLNNQMKIKQLWNPPDFLRVSRHYPDISPHPLFNPAFMRQRLGDDWLNKYIFDQSEERPLPPNEITSFGFLASQLYTDVPIWRAPFVHKDTSACVDFNLELYSQLCSLHRISPWHGFFADYCLRSNYKILPHSSYPSLFS